MKNSFDKKFLEKINHWLETNQKIALATVIQTWGSSPQPIGSKMIVNENANFAGSVSGGCVESAVINECLEILKKNTHLYYIIYIYKSIRIHVTY